MSDDYVSVSATVRASSPDAVCLETEEGEFWVPRSCIHGGDDLWLRGAHRVGEDREFRIRRWFVEKKEMI